MFGAALAIVLATSPVHAIIWGGGTSPADAEAQLKDADSTLWQEYFRLAADFPRAVESKTVGTIGSFETCRGTRYKVALTVAEGKLVEKSSASPYQQAHCERQGERATPVLGD